MLEVCAALGGLAAAIERLEAAKLLRMGPDIIICAGPDELSAN